RQLDSHHILTFYMFFLTRSGAHRDLHSFPTRRSSDLVLVQRPESVPIVRLSAFEGDFHREKAFVGGSTEFDIKQRFSLSARSKADRKSTRLNSSHVKISYAVFCLKKKKKTKLDILIYL